MKIGALSRFYCQKSCLKFYSQPRKLVPTASFRIKTASRYINFPPCCSLSTQIMGQVFIQYECEPSLSAEESEVSMSVCLCVFLGQVSLQGCQSCSPLTAADAKLSSSPPVCSTAHLGADTVKTWTGFAMTGLYWMFKPFHECFRRLRNIIRATRAGQCGPKITSGYFVWIKDNKFDISFFLCWHFNDKYLTSNFNTLSFSKTFSTAHKVVNFFFTLLMKLNDKSYSNAKHPITSHNKSEVEWKSFL